MRISLHSATGIAAAICLAAVVPVIALGASPQQRHVLRLEGVEANDYRSPVVTAVAISADGSRIAAGGDDHRLRVWDAATGATLQTLTSHKDWIRGARFAEDADRLVSVGADRSVCLWSFAGENEPQEHRRLAGGSLQAVAWRPDGQAIATAGFGDTLRLFDLLDEDAPPTEMACACQDTRAVAFSPDGRWIAAAGRNGVVRMWDLVASGGSRDLPSDGRRVRALAFSPDGETLAAGGDGPAVRLWRIEDGVVGTTPDELLIRPGKIHSLTFVEESVLAAGGTRNEVRLWDTDARSVRETLTGHTGTVAALAVSEDGRRLVSGSFDTTVRVWDLDQAAAAQPRTAARPTGKRAGR